MTRRVLAKKESIVPRAPGAQRVRNRINASWPPAKSQFQRVLHAMDASTVRSEIKTWERNFKAQQGREASVDDIKADQGIGAWFSTICRFLRVMTLVT